METPRRRNTPQSSSSTFLSKLAAFHVLPSSRIQHIQSDMTHRALELLNLSPDEPKLLLDIGCGSGLSGEILDEEGHYWVGVDIAPSMLGECADNDVRPKILSIFERWHWTGKLKGTFFFMISGRDSDFVPEALTGQSGVSSSKQIQFHCSKSSSISVIQWLLNAETSHPTSSPPHRLNRFFTTLYASLTNPSRAILQFYPNSDDQINLITSIAQKAGFGGGIVIDYPNSKKARKVFLCLFVGSGGGQQNLPKGLDGEEPIEGEDSVKYERRRERENRRDRSGKRKSVKAKDWILKKKELRVARSGNF